MAEAEVADGLIRSSTPRKPIPLDSGTSAFHPNANDNSAAQTLDLDWLSRPLSGATLALAIDTLIVFAATLVFFLVFFSVSSELPEWPLNVGLGLAIAIFVGAFYWGFFQTMAGTTLGGSLSRMVDSDLKGKLRTERATRFR